MKQKEYLEQIAKFRKGKTYEEIFGIEKAKEHKRKQSETKKRLGLRPPSPLGRILSQITKDKIRDKLKGRKIPLELREKYRLAHIGCQALEKNPRWIDGRSFLPYTIEFNEKLKELIRKRDNYICRKCGIKQESYFERLSIHHKDYVKENCNVENLVTVCRRCNSDLNNKKYRIMSIEELKQVFIY